VSVGGGATHRLNLFDAVLIKDNHLALNEDFKSVVLGLNNVKKGRFTEIEFDNLNQVKLFAKYFKQSDRRRNFVMMLDNFNPADVKKAVGVLKKTGVLIEVSGGINGKNIKSYAIKGVSAISSGAITNRADSLDLSLNILTTKRRYNETTNVLYLRINIYHRSRFREFCQRYYSSSACKGGGNFVGAF
ncbi:hypothetical protein KJ742_00750, partial [Patescibacteria group bacterium]|nr:hypothetical protein [Patescibacteria group bacterium]